MTWQDDSGAPTIVTLGERQHRTRAERTLPCGHTVPARTLYREWVGLVDDEFTVHVECWECFARSMQ